MRYWSLFLFVRSCSEILLFTRSRALSSSVRVMGRKRKIDESVSDEATGTAQEVKADQTPPPKKARISSKESDSEATDGASSTKTKEEKKKADEPVSDESARPSQEGKTDKASPAKKPKTSSKKNDPEETDGGILSKKKEKKKGAGAVKVAKNKTDWTSVKWNELGQTKDSRPWTKKISTWNVNGIRAWLKNDGLEYLTHEDPDIFCVQETKCSEQDLPMGQLSVPGYHIYWHSAKQKGYSGVGLYSKEKPLSVTNGLGIEKYDCEGRIITAEYEHFYFLTAYVPNAGEGLKRLSFKQSWDVDLREYMNELDKKKPVILCGDLNVAHKETDLKNPKTNTATAGFTPEERQDFTELLDTGFVDTFRYFYPDLTGAYTYWSYRFNGRAKNTGWRLDYFVISDRLKPHVSDCVIRKEVYGSDHCPLVIGLADHTHLPHPHEIATEDKPATTSDDGQSIIIAV